MAANEPFVLPDWYIGGTKSGPNDFIFDNAFNRNLVRESSLKNFDDVTRKKFYKLIVALREGYINQRRIPRTWRNKLYDAILRDRYIDTLIYI